MKTTDRSVKIPFQKSWTELVLENLYEIVVPLFGAKYLNLEGFLEKSLKIKSALKSTGKSLNHSIWILTESTIPLKLVLWV